MSTNTIVERARISYVGHLRRAESRGDYLRTIVPGAGVTGNGNVLYKGGAIGAYTMLDDGVVDRRGNTAPLDDPDAVRAWFRRAAAA